MAKRDPNFSTTKRAAPEKPSKPPLPTGFRYRRDDNVEFEDKAGVWNWLCTPLEVVAATRDAENSNWGRLTRVRDRDGHWHTWAMPMAMTSGRPDDILKELLSRGLEICPGGGKALLRLLVEAPTDIRIRCVDRPGWHDGAFVMSERTIGCSNDEQVILQARAIAPGRSCGSLQDWQSNVATGCASATRLTFAISAAFAAPLLDIAFIENGGFHFRGPSSIGKTTMLGLAASVWGDPNGYVQSWRATDNGLEAVAQAHCDRLLCLDELSQVAPEAAGEVAYMLANGRGKQRATKDGQARATAAWRCLFLSTGEISLEAKLAEGKGPKRIAAGQEVRVLDIPADAGAGLGIFDRVPDGCSPAALAQELAAASQRSYGTAGLAFVEQLVLRRNEVGGIVEKLVDRFMAEVARDFDGQVQRAARRFGLVAAAGELAILFGILPFNEGDAMAAAKKCFDDWLHARGSTGPVELVRGIQQVRAFIEQFGASRFAAKHGPNRPIQNRAGFRDGDLYYVFLTAWRDEICKGFDPQLLAGEMLKKRMLVPDGEGKATKPVRLPGFPKPQRVYVIDANVLCAEESSE